MSATRPPIVYPLPHDVFQTPSFNKLSDRIGQEEAVWLMWITAAIESDFRNYPLSPQSPSGIWQITPKTMELLKKKYLLPPYSTDDIATQGQYGATMLLESANFLSAYGVPPVVKKFLGNRPVTEKLLSLLSMRAYYHGGPSIHDANASLLKKKGLNGTHEDDILSGLAKAYNYYLLSVS